MWLWIQRANAGGAIGERITIDTQITHSYNRAYKLKTTSVAWRVVFVAACVRVLTTRVCAFTYHHCVYLPNVQAQQC
jgi:hypothetical protein